MFLTSARSALSFAGLPRVASAGTGIGRPADVARPRARRTRVAARAVTHSLLADAGGVWAWSVDDAYARPARYTNVQAWLEVNPGAKLQMWLAADLNSDRSPDCRIDLDLVRLHATRSEVDIHFIEPWWTHALVEAKRCVPALSRTGHAEVCVVEGREVNFISVGSGDLSGSSRMTLESATLGALQNALDTRSRSREHPLRLTVALGQGLFDGDRTNGLSAHVLGRLDGHQPPHWLRPTARAKHA